MQSEGIVVSAEARWKLAEVDLLAAYHRARRDYVEKMFARDSEGARLEWLRAKAFDNASGGVMERRNVVEASEEFGRKGQQLCEMTRDPDLLKADVDLIAMIVRLRGVALAGDTKADEAGAGDEPEEGVGPA
jgi:hypothetical protein